MISDRSNFRLNYLVFVGLVVRFLIVFGILDVISFGGVPWTLDGISI